MLATANAPTAGAQKVTSAETSQTSVLPVTGVSEGTSESVAKARAKGSNTTKVYALPIHDESVLITGPDKTNGLLSIFANEKIKKVSIYQLSGECIGSVYGSGSSITIPASSLNINHSGIYVISVETQRA